MKPFLHSSMLQSLVSTICACRVLCAAGQPVSAESLVQLQGDLDWRFWIALTCLVVMSGRQLAQDVLGLCAWWSPATPVTHEAVPGVAAPSVPAVPIALDHTATSDSSMIGAVEPVVISSSSGPVPPPSVPIFVSRHGERYHYKKECSGLRMAIPLGIESKTLCKTCAADRSR
jgi:hypothetical protein